MRTSPIQFCIRVNDNKLHRPQNVDAPAIEGSTVQKVIDGHTFTINVHGQSKWSERERYGFCHSVLYEEPAYSIRFFGEYRNLVRLRQTIYYTIDAIKQMGVDYWHRRAFLLGRYEVEVEMNQVPIVCDRPDLFFFACTEYDRAAQYKGWYVLSYNRLYDYHDFMGSEFSDFVKSHDIILGRDDSVQYYYCFKDLTVQNITNIFKLSMIIDFNERMAAQKIRRYSEKIFKITTKKIYDEVGECL
jgi:hypothetical protein